mgnify:CR=1 FL=1
MKDWLNILSLVVFQHVWQLIKLGGNWLRNIQDQSGQNSNKGESQLNRHSAFTLEFRGRIV